MSISLRIRATFCACLAWCSLALLAPALANAAQGSSSNVDPPGQDSGQQVVVTVSITDGPSEHRFTTDRTPSFGFRSNHPNATFDCRFDQGSWYPCSSPHRSAPLGDGFHEFFVKATFDGREGQARRRFLVDHDFVPDTVITSGPANRETIRDDTPTFTFRALNRRHFDGGGHHSYDPHRGDYGNDGRDDGYGGYGGSGQSGSGQHFDHRDGFHARFECRVDDGYWFNCWSPHTTRSLSDGLHTFAVRAIVHHRVDPTPATRTFTVDRGIPDTTITGGPAHGETTTNASPTFSFTSNRVGATFTCSVDGAAAYGCSSPTTIGPLVDGTHTFTVTATSSGLVDPSPATRTFRVDVPDNGVTPPPLIITQQLPGSATAGTVVKSRVTIVSTAGIIGMTGVTRVVVRCSSGDRACVGNLKIVKTIRFRCADRFCFSRKTLSTARFTIPTGTQMAVRARVTGEGLRMVRNTSLDRLLVLAQASCEANRSQKAMLLIGRRVA